MNIPKRESENVSRALILSSVGIYGFCNESVCGCACAVAMARQKANDSIDKYLFITTVFSVSFGIIIKYSKKREQKQSFTLILPSASVYMDTKWTNIVKVESRVKFT